MYDSPKSSMVSIESLAKPHGQYHFLILEIVNVCLKTTPKDQRQFFGGKEKVNK